MNNPHDGGAAFPSDQPAMGYGPDARLIQPGMSLLDHFAGLAMQSLIGKTTLQNCFTADNIAVKAYDYAEAMIEERSRRADR